VRSAECGQVGHRPEPLSVGDLIPEYATITLEMESHNKRRTVTISRKQEIFFDWMSDVLVYTVVLNLFVEHVDNVVIDSFTISIFTAVLLKILLDIVMRAEHAVTAFWGGKEGTAAAIFGKVSLVVVLFFGKLLILWAVDIVFGDHVDLGHFIEVVALVLALMITRELVHRLFLALGNPAKDA
jgi:hypothetical protein